MSATEWIGFAALIVMVAVLTGCGDVMTKAEIEWAIEACAPRGGLQAAEVDRGVGSRVVVRGRCADGVTLYTTLTLIR